MYLIVLPSFGTLLFKLKTVTKLVLVGFTFTDKTSAVEVGSVWSPLAAVVFKVSVFPAWSLATVATIVKVSVVFWVILPIVHKPEPSL